MRTIRTVAELRAALGPARRAEHAIGLVPTMGALHEGHLSLIRRAGEQCEEVVVSLFVNPTQFNQGADLERYPRQEERDAALAAEAGAHLLFAPAVEEIYPPGFASSVEVAGVSAPLEGRARGAGHFRGVSTVVAKLLNIAMPDVVYFGQKDAQQVAVVRRMVADLNLPVRVEVCPTVREPDGLAMSSRNAHLNRAQRAQALALSAALRAASALASAGEQAAAPLLDAARQAMSPFELEPEYLALVDVETLQPLQLLERPALLAVAARVGETRLIDNVILYPTAAPARNPQPGKAATRCSV